MKAAISFSISQARIKNSIPKSAQVIVPEAELKALDSPPEVIILIPAQVSIMMTKIKATPTERLIILWISS